MMPNMESVISGARGCGRFQVFQVLSVTGVRLVAMWGVMIMAFGNYDPGWQCLHGANLTGTTPNSDVFSNISKDHLAFEIQDGMASLSINSKVSNDSRKLNASFFPPRDKELLEYYIKLPWRNDSNASMTAAIYQTSCHAFERCPAVKFRPGTQTIVTEWQLVCQHSWIVSLVISIQMAGFFVGCAMAGHVSERSGRRTALYGSSVVNSVANLVASFSVSWMMYASCLFFVGIGTGGVLTVALVYCFEFLGPRSRGILGGLPLSNLSQTAFSLLVFLVRDWRYLHITIAGMSGIMSLTVFWVPESTRWLAVHGRINDAKAVIEKIARVNGRHCDQQEVTAALVVLQNDHKGENQGQFTYLDLFSRNTLRWTTIKLILIWICEVTVYYALTFAVKVFSGDFYLNLFIYSSVEIPIVIFVGPMTNWIGRKNCGVTMFFLATFTSLGVAVIQLVTNTEASAMAILILATLTKSFASGGRCVVTIVTGELPPTVVRNLTFGFCMLFSRLGCIIAPYLVPDQRTLHVSFSIMAGLLFLTGAIFISLPETSERPMADKLGLKSSVRVRMSADRRLDSDCDVIQESHQSCSQISQGINKYEST